MNVKSVHAIAVAVLIGLSAPVLAAQADPVVEQGVRNLQAVVGQTNEHGYTVESARAEGRTLVMVVSMPEGMQGVFTPAQLTGFVALGMCGSAEGARFFGEGRMLRVDVVAGGRTTGGASLAACPDQAAIEPTAANFARGMQPSIGRRFEGGLTFSGARAEGNRLILTLDGPQGWRGRTGMRDITHSFLSGFCRQQTEWNYFGGGRTLQIEALEAGRDPSLGEVIDRCPAP